MIRIFFLSQSSPILELFPFDKITLKSYICTVVTVMAKQCWSQTVLESGSWGHSVLQTPALVDFAKKSCRNAAFMELWNFTASVVVTIMHHWLLQELCYTYLRCSYETMIVPSWNSHKLFCSLPIFIFEHNVFLFVVIWQADFLRMTSLRQMEHFPWNWKAILWVFSL